MVRTFVEGWNIVQVLGEGAYGEVQLLINTSTQETVAVKNLDSRREPEAENNIQKEVFIHRRLKHEYIIRYFGHREESPFHYIFLEYAPGGELFDRIEPDVGMPLPKAQKYFCQIMKGVEYLHSLGITHRDLKPENILLDKNDNVKISDFGLATIFRHKGKERILTNRCGTIPYVAPEVFTKKYKAEPADIWSCGILLVTMLAGELPWDQATDDCRRFVQWKSSNYSKSPWPKIDTLSLSLLKKILEYLPSKRCSISYIQKHMWCRKFLSHDGNVKWSGDTITYKRLCSDMDLNPVLKDESMFKLSYSQPVNCFKEPESTSDQPDSLSNLTMGVSFSQPVDPENMMFSQSPNSQKTMVPMGMRLTRLCVKVKPVELFSELKKVFNNLNYSWKRSGPGQITITTQDRRRVALVFKANLITMSERILIDFRRSKGDGIEFKRHFLKIKEKLSHIVDTQPFFGAVTNPNV